MADVAEFLDDLGSAADFVTYAERQEASLKGPQGSGPRGAANTRREVLNTLTNFFGTETGKRYLVVLGDEVSVVDFRHFFAAAAEALDSGMSRSKPGIALGGSARSAMLLGLAKEMGQCIEELPGWSRGKRWQSCFSSEDLGSNRLGAAFGAELLRAESEASMAAFHSLLWEFLQDRQPVQAARVVSIVPASKLVVAKEAVLALLRGLHALVESEAW